jgi:hypothetical protein
MDPIGFGFEAYDGLGRFRTTDPSGKPVDDSGSLDMTRDANGPFKGPIELGKKLAASSQVRECLIDTALLYAGGPDAAGDACVRQKVAGAFEIARHDIKELFVGLARTESFRYRRALPGEVLP